MVITNYNGKSTQLTIPNTLRGKPVVKIGYSAFGNCTSLTSAIYKGKTYDYAHIDDLYNAINSR